MPPEAEIPVACACGGTPLFRRVARALRWLGPGVLLAVMPKCPACLAAYVALCSGVVLSVTAASWLRGGLIALCVATLAWTAWRTWRRRAPLTVSSSDPSSSSCRRRAS